MSDDQFDVEPLGSDLTGWLELGGPEDDTTARELLSAIDARPQVERFLIRGRGTAIGRFAIEWGAVGARTWTPRLRAGIEGDMKRAMMDAAVAAILRRVADRQAPFVETVLRRCSTRPPADPWRDALLKRGFELLATKAERQWIGRRIDVDRACREASVGGVHVDVVPPTSHGLHAAAREICETSLDPTLVAEARYGLDLGDLHRFHAAVVKGNIVGLVGTSDGRPGRSGWIGLVGTQPAWRRCGVASVLVTAAMADMVTSGTWTIRALVADRNHPSMMLFGSLGFADTGERSDVAWWETR